MTLNFDPALCPFPPYEERFALNKVDGTGQDDLGPRTFRGNAWHRGLTMNQTLDQAVTYLISRAAPGLTDGYIDNRTGRLVMMNPMDALFKLPDWWEDRAGWANGVYGKGRAPSPDAAAFVAKFGPTMTARGFGAANIINQDLESYEILGNYDTELLEPAKATMVAISANRAQILKIPYDQWPVHPVWKTSVLYGHREFTLKDCPGEVVWEFINNELVVRTREVLRKAQTGSATAPIPAPKPTPAPVPVPGHVDTPLIEELFGSAGGFSFDPKGVISNLWLKAGEATGEFPRLSAVTVHGDVRSFVFSNGMVLQHNTKTSAVTRLTNLKG